MAALKIARKQRLAATIAISFSFFVAELTAGFYTHSLALVADAFHYLSDLVGFAVALTALIVSERAQPPPKEFTFGWQRATLLGAFFNGVFLLALGVSILVQAIERFTIPTPIEKPKVVLIIGCVGLALNLLVMSFLHEHDHAQEHTYGHEHRRGHRRQDSAAIQGEDGLAYTHASEHEVQTEMRELPTSSDHHHHKHASVIVPGSGKDLGLLGVFIHVVGDAINNVGVIASAVIIWRAQSPARFYADPAIGSFIAFMIFLTAVPLTRSSGRILLQIAPGDINLEDIKHDIEMIPGIESVHELHIWRLDQKKSVASAHVVIDGRTVKGFSEKAKTIMECLHAYGIHSATLQPEVRPQQAEPRSSRDESVRQRSACQLVCGTVCGEMRCCP